MNWLQRFKEKLWASPRCWSLPQDGPSKLDCMVCGEDASAYEHTIHQCIQRIRAQSKTLITALERRVRDLESDNMIENTTIKLKIVELETKICLHTNSDIEAHFPIQHKIIELDSAEDRQWNSLKEVKKRVTELESIIREEGLDSLKEGRAFYILVKRVNELGSFEATHWRSITDQGIRISMLEKRVNDLERKIRLHTKSDIKALNLEIDVNLLKKTTKAQWDDLLNLRARLSIPPHNFPDKADTKEQSHTPTGEQT